ncbi:MAG: VWA domain-containing protein [Candidatus Eisenbacteria bacterium]|uniref:VWA domain-containing protein n=1 Tax=Eiseniibacteriota bacterium TaxID=2212470 RepID=A0A7Y2H0N7_UNCEI|nr:VWA domain-containing protein [Candidatus Eisenbacteria bacterium]
MRFASPLFLLALIPLIFLFWWDLRRRWSRPPLAVSDLSLFPVHGWRGRFVEKLPWFWLLAGILLVIALARPQTGAERIELKSEGIDIVLAIDTSGSMRAEDFKPNNRLVVAKSVAREFVEGRSGDRVGLVVFSGAAYTQCPLTLDYGVLMDLLDEVDFGQPDGTAVGMALATATNRLREAEGEGRVVILLTDGQNNAGEVDPITAAEAARALGIRVYTIGAGTDGPARIPVDDPIFGKRYVTMEARLDEDTLKQIASLTGGKYYRATSARALEQIYEEIDALEKTEVETFEYVQYNERGPFLALLGVLCLGSALLFSESLGSRIP